MHLRKLFLFSILISVFSSFAGTSYGKGISIGSKADTETQVLAEIVKYQLNKNGFEIEHKANLGGTMIPWRALLNGSVQIIPEYLGTIKEQLLQMKGPHSKREIHEALNNLGIEMTEGLGFQNGYGLAVTAQTAKKFSLKKISDLKQEGLDLHFAITHEFIKRQEGWQTLKYFYGLPNYPIRGFDHQLGYQALINEKAQVKDVYTTDAMIRRKNLVILEDDKDFFPDYSAVFLYRKSLPKKVIKYLHSLDGTIEVEQIRQLNNIAEDTKNPETAAKFFWGESCESEESFSKQTIHLAHLFSEHLVLVIVSLIFAVTLGFPLGLLGSRGGHTMTIILAIGGVLQSIPSLALLALLIPIFGISKWTAIFALLVNSIFPIVRSTAVGLSSIPNQFKTVANALGLSKRALLYKIYIPIALPNILTGIKTSTIWIISTATLAALIGAGGLGELIVSGITLNNYDSILLGAIPVSLLAIITELGFRYLDKKLISNGETFNQYRKIFDQQSHLAEVGKTTQMIAHDIRQPFTMLKCLVGLINSSEPSQVKGLVNRYSASITNSYQNVSNMLEDIMEIGKENQLNIDNVEPLEMLKESLESIFLPNTAFVANFSYSLNYSHKVTVDKLKIQRVFRNIIQNALDANAGKVDFEFNILEQSKMLNIEIVNKGKTIPEEHLGRVFEAFFSKDKSTGTGLGLAISKKIIEDHQGSIYCQSCAKLGKTVFGVNLPISDVAKNAIVKLPSNHSEVIIPEK